MYSKSTFTFDHLKCQTNDENNGILDYECLLIINGLNFQMCGKHLSPCIKN